MIKNDQKVAQTPVKNDHLGTFFRAFGHLKNATRKATQIFP